MGKMKEKQVYTVSEVAALTGLSRSTITRMFERERASSSLRVQSPCTSGLIEAYAYHALCMSASLPACWLSEPCGM
jgi:hypothetical protein